MFLTDSFKRRSERERCGKNADGASPGLTRGEKGLHGLHGLHRFTPVYTRARYVLLYYTNVQ